jgi:predicted O-methyltransferase YrrM
MHQVIEDFYRTAGTKELQSAVSREEGQLIQEQIRRRNAVHTLEIGCANGLSSLFICDALARQPGARHTIIDPFQTTEYRRAGVDKLDRAGFRFYELIEEGSEYALPALCRGGARFDFCLIDGCHTFDHTLLDFFYVNRILKVGGVVAFDDTNMPAVNKVAHYVATYPCYRVLATLNNCGWRRQLVNRGKLGLAWATWPLKKLAGMRLSQEILDGTIVRPWLTRACDFSSMIAFEKITEDQRNCNWYQYF